MDAEGLGINAFLDLKSMRELKLYLSTKSKQTVNVTPKRRGKEGRYDFGLGFLKIPLNQCHLQNQLIINYFLEGTYFYGNVYSLGLLQKSWTQIEHPWSPMRELSRGPRSCFGELLSPGPAASTVQDRLIQFEVGSGLT
ncbi:unnamed protein product [Allacma fusca]|uniref:Uncharacterized protein n=1 Tax=Allacma fusca TaxID=39272 RepID=A0A8J2PVN0_9HEXA|nr:unnamed protein product [Allacma fusca]